MKIFRFAALFTIFLCSIQIFSQTVPPESDVQAWSEVQLTFPVIKKKDEKGKEFDQLTFFLVGNLRFGQNLRHFVDERIGFGLDFRVNKNLSLTSAYLYIAAQPLKNRREFENRLRLAATVEKKFRRFSLKDRNLFEYRIRNSRSDSTRYRNRLTFAFPVLKNDKEIFSPFAANEIYYDFSTKNVTRNEVSAGISRKINSNVSTDIFYLWRRNRGNVLTNVNVIGANLKIRID
jgi:hypothetical protein